MFCTLGLPKETQEHKHHTACLKYEHVPHVTPSTHCKSVNFRTRWQVPYTFNAGTELGITDCICALQQLLTREEIADTQNLQKAEPFRRTHIIVSKGTASKGRTFVTSTLFD